MNLPQPIMSWLLACCVFGGSAAGLQDNRSFWDNFERICEAPRSASTALLQGTWRPELDRAMAEILSTAGRAGVPLKKLERGETIRFGAKFADPGRPSHWLRAEAPDNSYWIDLLAYERTLHAQTVMGHVNQAHSGVMEPRRATFITLRVDGGRDAVAAVVRNGRSIINVGYQVPFKILAPSEGENSASELLEVANAIDRVAWLLDVSREALLLSKREQLDPAPEVSVRTRRIAGLARIWSEVRYNFVFIDERPGLDWDRAFTEFLPRVEAAENDAAYVAVLEEFVALLKDGHSWVYPTGSARELTDSPPLLIVPVEGQPVIVDVADELRTRIAPGTAITSIDGVAVGEYLATHIHPRICASTTQDRNERACARLLDGIPGTTVEVVLTRPDGSSDRLDLRRDASKHEAFQARQTRPPFEIRELAGGEVYVALNTFADAVVVEEFDQHFEQILGAPALILDLRENQGGSTRHAFAILSRLISEPNQHTSRWRTRVHRPAFHAWGHPSEWFEGRHGVVEPRGEQPFSGPVAVLIGPRTYSAAEDFLVPIQSSGRAQLVGKPTGGSTGQPLTFNVHAARVGIVSKWDYLPGGGEFVGVGILPDVEIEATRADIAAGRDAVLERALELVRDQR